LQEYGNRYYVLCWNIKVKKYYAENNEKLLTVQDSYKCYMF
jgi:hypothetical protein